MEESKKMEDNSTEESKKMAEDNDTAQTAPLCLQPTATRRATDKLFFFVLFPLNLALWLGFGIHGVLEDSDYYTVQKSVKFYPMLKKYSINFSTYGLPAVLVIILLLFILSKLRDNWVVSVITTFIVTVTLTLIGLTFWQLALIDEIPNFLQIILLILTAVCLIYHVTIYICTKKVGATTLGPMMKQPFEAIICSFSALLVSFVIFFLLALVFILTAIVIFIMKPPEGEPKTFLIWMRIGLFALGGMYIFNFIWNCGFMIMEDYFANSYGSSGNQKGTYVFRSIATVVKYHLGTIAFLSIPIFPSICALVMAFKQNDKQLDKQSGNKLVNFISKIFLIIDISTYALIQTSIYGHKSLKSITEMFDLLRSNPVLFLTTYAIPFKIVEIGMIITIIIGTIAQMLYGSFDYERYIPDNEYHTTQLTKDEFNVKVMTDIVWAIIYANIVTSFLVRPATCTFSICKMISRRESKTMEDQQALTAEP